MAFADKYKDKVSKTFKTIVDKKRRNKTDLDKILKDEEEQRKLWEERKRKIRDSEIAREAELLNAWGMVVMASGFADEYPENFGLLEAVIRDAMEKMKNDPDVMDSYLAMLAPAGKGTV